MHSPLGKNTVIYKNVFLAKWKTECQNEGFSCHWTKNIVACKRLLFCIFHVSGREVLWPRERDLSDLSLSSMYLASFEIGNFFLKMPFFLTIFSSISGLHLSNERLEKKSTFALLCAILSLPSFPLSPPSWSNSLSAKNLTKNVYT